MADILNTVFRPSGAEIIFRDFGEELVVANLNSGLFYSLVGSAGTIWTALVNGFTGRQIAAAFQTEEAETIAKEVEAFIVVLMAEELLSAAPSAVAATSLPLLDSFSKPTFERFDDLQGLLLLDPIHEVSEAGWPVVPSQALSS